MIKSELIKAVAGKVGFTQKDTELFINGFLETVEETLLEGEPVNLVGFGNFKVVDRAEREGRNPQTGETIMIPARKSPSFKFGKAFKDKFK